MAHGFHLAVQRDGTATVHGSGNGGSGNSRGLHGPRQGSSEDGGEEERRSLDSGGQDVWIVSTRPITHHWTPLEPVCCGTQDFRRMAQAFHFM